MAHTNTITRAQAEAHARNYANRLKNGELIGHGADGEEFWFDLSSPTLVTASGADGDEMLALSRADAEGILAVARAYGAPEDELAALVRALG